MNAELYDTAVALLREMSLNLHAPDPFERPEECQCGQCDYRRRVRAFLEASDDAEQAEAISQRESQP